MKQSNDNSLNLKQEQNELKEKYEILFNAINSTDSNITIVDEKGTIIFKSKTFLELEETGNEVIGTSVSESYRYINFKTSISKSVIQNKTILKNKHVKYITPKGKLMSMYCDFFPIYSEDKIIGCIVISKTQEAIKSMVDNYFNIHNTTRASNKTKDINAYHTFDDIIGSSHIIKDLIKQSKQISTNLSSVLLLGETGVGKEIFAQSIHKHGPRSSGPFVAINCSAIPENLLESILFGTSKGSFTGAQEKMGLFEEANNGTLFLDEISAMNVLLQNKILRALETKKIRRIGSNEEKPISPRIISAMNSDPQIAITEGILRKDLYYRLAVITINIPPLKERMEDLPEILNYYIKHYNNVFGNSIQGISEDVLKIFENHNWPGNVRELIHVIEHALNMVDSKDKLVLLEHLPSHLVKNTLAYNITSNEPNIQDLRKNLSTIEKDAIANALNNHHGNINQTAKSLNVSRQYLHYKLKKLGILPK